ncbi:hypothetical protein KAF44_28195 (plasmid) [Cupriavidus necator]|nr:hypothetical protein KAF44_28195 [Cupriavidus necator]
MMSARSSRALGFQCSARVKRYPALCDPLPQRRAALGKIGLDLGVRKGRAGVIQRLLDLLAEPLVIGSRGVRLLERGRPVGPRSALGRLRIVAGRVHVEAANAQVAQEGHQRFELAEHAHVAALGRQETLGQAVLGSDGPAVAVADDMRRAHSASFHELGKGLLIDGLGGHGETSVSSEVGQLALAMVLGHFYYCTHHHFTIQWETWNF